MDVHLKRMWINQPSTLQPDHELHGVNVLFNPKQEPVKGVVDVWFTSGNVVSQRIHRSSLSDGWPSQAERAESVVCTCGHMAEDHERGECFNGEGSGNRCSCRHQQP